MVNTRFGTGGTEVKNSAVDVIGNYVLAIQIVHLGRATAKHGTQYAKESENNEHNRNFLKHLKTILNINLNIKA